MSKEKNKGQGSFVQQKTFFFPEIIEKEARDDLAKGKFRQAKDGFKELYKRDKDKYLPELLECYRGMAHQMIQNGQLSDAAQIVDQMKFLTRNKSEGTLELLIAIKKKDYDAVDRIYAGIVSEGKDISDSKESSLVADVLVIAFREFPRLKAVCPKTDEELHAVQHALEDISAERYEDAWLKAQKVTVHSPFSNWKLFIKGLIAFYKKDDQKARDALGRLSADTLLQGIAKPYLALLDNKAIDQDKRNEAFLKKMCVVAGYQELVSVLPAADYLWKSGRYYDSYRHIRNGMKCFPTEEPGIAGILTRFYFNSIHHLPERAAMKYLDDLRIKKMIVSPERPLENVLIGRAESLFLENMFVADEEDDNDCARVWEEFLRTYTAAFGMNNRLEALVYFHLGSTFAAEDLQEPPLFPWLSPHKKRNRLRNARLAALYFNKSAALDKNNKEACLGLLKVYEKTQNQSKVNKLLDKLVPLFPDDSAILTQAGIGSTNRKAFVKGIKYLEQAVQLDPLNSTIRDHLAFSYIQAARSLFDKGQVKQGRDIFEKAVKNGTSNQRDFNRGYAYLYARWAALEQKNRGDDVAAEKLQIALDKTEKRLPLLYFAQLISRCYGLPDSYTQKLGAEVDREWHLPATPGNAVSLLMVYSYIDIFGFAWSKSELKRVARYAFDASDKPCSREEALDIIHFAFSDKQTRKLGDVYIKKILGEDKDDPEFHYLKYQSQVAQRSLPPGKEDVEELKRILRLAEKRNNGELVRDLKKRIKDLEELFAAGEALKYIGDDEFDQNDQDMKTDLEFLRKLFDEINRTEGGKGKRK